MSHISTDPCRTGLLERFVSWRWQPDAVMWRLGQVPLENCLVIASILALCSFYEPAQRLLVDRRQFEDGVGLWGNDAPFILADGSVRDSNLCRSLC